MKYSVMQFVGERTFDVIEWESDFNGKVVGKFENELEADYECAILNAGYEYTLGETQPSEFEYERTTG